MTNITLYRDSTRDSACVERCDLELFADAWIDYVFRVQKAATLAGFAVRIAPRRRATYTISDGNEDAHAMMQSIKFWP